METTIDKLGLITIIDSYFDGNDATPYDIEQNANIYSFLVKCYTVLKDETTFSNTTLVTTYVKCLKDLIAKLNYIENSKIKKYKLSEYTLTELVDFINYINSKYVDRDFSEVELSAEDRKSGYLNSDETYNGYKETVYIGASIKEEYQSDGTIDYTKNPNLIKLNKDGTAKLYITGDNASDIDLNSYTKESYTDSDGNTGTCYTREFVSVSALTKVVNSLGGKIVDFIKTNIIDPEDDSKNIYSVSIAFEDGFLVDDYNEYESFNGTLLEILNAIKDSFEDSSCNYFEKYLKRYFYKGIVERYRTKQFMDTEVGLSISDSNTQTPFRAINKVYQKFNGRGGSMLNPFSNVGKNRPNCHTYNYNTYSFEKSIYDCTNKILKLYVPKDLLTGDLKFVGHFKKFEFDSGNEDSYLYWLYNKYNNYRSTVSMPHVAYYDEVDEYGQIGSIVTDKKYNTATAKYIKKYSDDIKSEFIKNHFFAIKPIFTPVDVDNSSWNKSFYMKYVKTLEKDYGDIDFEFNSNYLILKLSIDLGIDSDETYELGEGYCYYQRVEQTYLDNEITNINSSSITTKDEYLNSKEFNSLMDDRETEVIVSSEILLANTSSAGYTNAYLNSSGTYVTAAFPDYKIATLKKTNGTYLLECSDFGKKNDLYSLKQIRVVNADANSKRYIFRVRDVQEETETSETLKLVFNCDSDDTVDLSYFDSTALRVIDSDFYGYSVQNSSKILSIKSSEDEIISYDSENSELILTPSETISDEDTEIAGSSLKIGSKYGVEYVYNSKSLVIEDDNAYIISAEELITIYSLVLLPSFETEDILNDGESMTVEIADWILTDGYNSNTSLKQSVYVEGSSEPYSDYEYRTDAIGLSQKATKFNYNIFVSKPNIMFDIENKINFNINNIVVKVNKEVEDTRFKVKTIFSVLKRIFNLKTKVESVIFDIANYVVGDAFTKSIEPVVTVSETLETRPQNFVKGLDKEMTIDTGLNEQNPEMLNTTDYAVRYRIHGLYTTGTSLKYSDSILGNVEETISVDSLKSALWTHDDITSEINPNEQKTETQSDTNGMFGFGIGVDEVNYGIRNAETVSVDENNINANFSIGVDEVNYGIRNAETVSVDENNINGMFGFGIGVDEVNYGIRNAETVSVDENNINANFSIDEVSFALSINHKDDSGSDE